MNTATDAAPIDQAGGAFPVGGSSAADAAEGGRVIASGGTTSAGGNEASLRGSTGGVAARSRINSAGGDFTRSSLVAGGATARTSSVAGGSSSASSPAACGRDGYDLLVLTNESVLLRVRLPSFDVQSIGKVECGVALNSMATTQSGSIYIASHTGELFLVDSRTAACKKTPFDASLVGRTPFAIGSGPGPDRSEDVLWVTNDTWIGWIDPQDFSLHDQLDASARIEQAEVLATPDGDKFAFTTSDNPPGIYYFELDTGYEKQVVSLPHEMTIVGYDFTWITGSFYLVYYTDPFAERSSVMRYTAATNRLELLGSIEGAALGAGSIACDPESSQ